MYAKNIISLYKILEEEPKTPTEAENREKDIKKYEKLVDNWIKKHSRKIKRIEKIFLYYINSHSKKMFNEIFGYPPAGGEPYCGKEAKETLEELFLAFKGSSKKLFSEVLKEQLLKSKSGPSAIFNSIYKLFEIVSFEKEDMLKTVDTISNLLKQSRENSKKDYKELEKYSDDCLESMESIYGKDAVYEMSMNLNGDRSELRLTLQNKSFPAFVESLVYDDHKHAGKITSLNKLIAKLKDGAKHTINRAFFRKKVNDYCRDFKIDLKNTMNDKIQEIYKEFEELKIKTVNESKEKINKQMEGIKKELSERLDKKSKSTRPLPIPPVRGKSSSDVSEKPLPTPQKNSIDENDKASQRKSVGRLSPEQKKIWEKSSRINNRPLPPIPTKKNKSSSDIPLSRASPQSQQQRSVDVTDRLSPEQKNFVIKSHLRDESSSSSTLKKDNNKSSIDKTNEKNKEQKISKRKKLKKRLSHMFSRKKSKESSKPDNNSSVK